MTGSSRPPLTAAVVQPLLTSGDVTGNSARHAETVRKAGARLVVFPELSLTGYVLGLPALDADAPAELEPIRRACAATGSAALVSAPVRDRDGQTYLGFLLVEASGSRLVYRKMCLGGDESQHFSPGPQPAVVRLDGWRLGLGICKDTGNHDQIAATAALGIDAYVAGIVHHADERGVQDDRAQQITAAHQVFVLFASYAGGTGEGYAETAGQSTIWSPSGTVLARASTRPDDLARAVLTAD